MNITSFPVTVKTGFISCFATPIVTPDTSFAIHIVPNDLWQKAVIRQFPDWDIEMCYSLDLDIT